MPFYGFIKIGNSRVIKPNLDSIFPI